MDLNPYHERIGANGHGYFATTETGQTCGVYAVPVGFADPEAGKVCVYGPAKEWLKLTPTEARNLAAALLRKADQAA